ncbi:MAG: signal peptide peptidase SppA [Polyangiaceae bacterium]
MKRWLATCVALTFALACEGRPRSGPVAKGKHSSAFLNLSSAKVVEFDLSRGVPEGAGGGGLFPTPASRTFVGLVSAMKRTLRDQDAKAVYVRLGGGALGMATSEEIGRLLRSVRDAGKPVVCHAHGLNNATAMLALTSCDRLWLSPAGEVETIGLAGQVLYFKGALDKFKVRADFVRAGRYKSAVESFTEEGPSEDSRASVTGVLRSIRRAWLDTTKKTPRKIADLEKNMELGPWSAQEAKRRGFVDELGYESDALADAKTRAGAERVSTSFGSSSEPKEGPDFGEILRSLSGADEGAGRPHVAVVVAEGSIAMQGGGLFGGGITAGAMEKILRRLKRSDAVKAVVLRIDSPGGSALASDVIWHELMELKKDKPLIVSVGGMAASGGYYMACPADRIFAENSSIVGSIGVFGGKIALGEAMAEYGVTSATFPASDNPDAQTRATYLSGVTRWDDKTRDRVQQNVLDIYALFLERVAAGRGLSVAEVKKSAEGRIWSGSQGLGRKLVDEIGGLSEAIAEARKRADLDERAPVVLEGGGEGILDSLLMGENASARELRLAAMRASLAQRVAAEQLPKDWLPYLGSISPLFEGERAVTATSLALRIR